jgi:hypothetical protein
MTYDKPLSSLAALGGLASGCTSDGTVCTLANKVQVAGTNLIILAIFSLKNWRKNGHLCLRGNDHKIAFQENRQIV